MNLLNQAFLLGMCLFMAGCVTKATQNLSPAFPSSLSKDIPQSEFDALAHELVGIHEVIESEMASYQIGRRWALENTTESIVKAVDKQGKETEILKVPAKYEIVTNTVLGGDSHERVFRLVFLNAQGVEESLVEIPARYRVIRVQSIQGTNKSQVFEPNEGETEISIYSRLTDYVQSVYFKYKDNKYFRVSGFSVDVSLPPSVTVDFEFRE